MQNLRIPGPTPVPPEVAQAGAAAMINHRGPEFADLIASVTERAKQVYRTTNDVLTLTASGTGAMEAAVVNHVDADAHVLVVTVGVFGKRFVELVEAYGGRVTHLEFEYGEAADPGRIEQALKADREIHTLMVTHNETSTGVQNVQLEEIAKLGHQYDCLVIVDAISSLSSVPVETDEWELDVVASGSQKGWMTAPGLAFISVSARAWERQAQVKTPRFYFDLDRAKSSLESGQTPWTPAVSLFFQLNRALDLMLEEGLENIFERHRRLARRTRDGVKALGLELLAREGVESETVTAVRVPAGVDGLELVRVARDDFDTVFAGGQADLRGKIFRFGHLGYVSEADVDAGLEALAGTLKRIGFAAVTNGS